MARLRLILCEHDLEVGHRRVQQLGRLDDPVGSPSTHALRAMSVGAGVVKIDRRVTSGTAILPASHRRGPAEAEAKQGAFHVRRQATVVTSDEGLGVTLEDLGDRYPGSPGRLSCI